VGNDATVRDLVQEISTKLDIPEEGMVLSSNPNLVEPTVQCIPYLLISHVWALEIVISC
jgi:hypothetical protein